MQSPSAAVTALSAMRKIPSPLGGFRSPFGPVSDFAGVPPLDGVYPSLYLDFTRDVFATRELDAQDYTLDGTDPALVLDFVNQTYGA